MRKISKNGVPRLKAKSLTTACPYNDIKMDIVVVIVVFPLSLSSLSDTDFSVYIFPFVPPCKLIHIS